MNELMGMTVAFVALVVAWKFWKRTVRDSVRDDLFDIRDEWRSYWIGRGMDLGIPAYAKFRSDINSYLRFTSTYRFSDLLYVHNNTGKIKAVLAAKGEQETYADHETRQKMAALRKRAIDSLQVYMVTTSIFIVPVIVVAVVAVFVKRLSFMVLFLKSSVKVANTVPYSRPEFIQQAVRLQPKCA